ncbi:PC4-domain-containing protein [Delitschia confertaspora ATCC 74209]|uniref:PC4-domain-containing protein n=1 Tax=Delitschia confertaspora ATCC 74209 TaxID=1513339 RepID=A0A9P4JL16_9PLEO|nr:PC4-domain-containing protein [Delitschia confertaspora ATCC 74209]
MAGTTARKPFNKKGVASKPKKRVISSASEGDSSPPPTKKPKASNQKDGDEEFLVPELLEDDNGDSYVKLNDKGTRRAVVSEFKGKTLINIREFYEKEGKTLPGSKGIALTLDQYNALLAAVPLIDAVLSEKGEKVTRPDYSGTASVAKDKDETSGQSGSDLEDQPKDAAKEKQDADAEEDKDE